MSGMRIHKVDENHADNHQTPIGEWWKPKEKKKKKEKMLTTASAVCRHRLFSRTVFLFSFRDRRQTILKKKSFFFFLTGNICVSFTFTHSRRGT
jgi:hypothetical protein